MSEDDSYIIKRRDSLDIDQIILEENRDALAEFLDQPLTAIAESVTGALAAGPKSWSVSSGKLVQAVLKGKLFQQLSSEIRELRAKGKIPEDFANKPFGYQSWTELMMIIDSETPDQERLDALKAMFYAVNKVNAVDAQRILGYQLFQIAKKLTSGQLLYLRACYDIFKSGTPPPMTASSRDWFRLVGKRLGYDIYSLLNLQDLALIELGLLSERSGVDRSGIPQANAHLTDLGIRFCEEIQTYHLDAHGKKK